jgi:hypothetical protein
MFQGREELTDRWVLLVQVVFVEVGLEDSRS